MVCATPLVSLQSAVIHESLTAHTANKRFMAGMHPLMRFQVISLTKSLTMHITFQGFRSSLQSLASFCGISPCQSLGTHALSGAVCFHSTPVTKAGVMAEGLWGQVLQVLPVKQNHVTLQTAEVNKGRGAAPTHMGSVQGGEWSGDDGRWHQLLDYSLVPHDGSWRRFGRMLLDHVAGFLKVLKQWK